MAASGTLWGVVRPAGVRPLFEGMSTVVGSFIVPAGTFRLFHFLAVFVEDPSAAATFFLLLGLEGLRAIQVLGLGCVLFSGDVNGGGFILSFWIWFVGVGSITSTGEDAEEPFYFSVVFSSTVPLLSGGVQAGWRVQFAGVPMFSGAAAPAPR